MSDRIEFPDIERLLASWLGSVTGVRAGTKKQPYTGPYVRVQRTGGIQHTLISDAPWVVVESYGESQSAANNLAATVRGFMRTLPGMSLEGSLIYRVEEVSGPGWLPALNGQSRYSQTFEVHVRGSAVT